MRHAARCKCRTQKSRQNRHLGTIGQLCRAISSQLRHISTIGKNLLSSNISPTCCHNMVNFGPLAAEIVSLVWGTRANFNGFRVLAALLHGSQAVSVSQTSRRRTEGATYVRRVTITLGIGLHSSCVMFLQMLMFLECCISRVMFCRPILMLRNYYVTYIYN